ncbi:aldo/keto reductase, partial [Trinickia symbiotica]
TPIEETMSALHTLVQSGKVRYIGVSDTPAWKATQAQLIAHFRGWSPFIGTQIEYSLAERTVEGELIPMARELGMGVVSWSPLAGGRISGKYTRENQAKAEGGRAAVLGPMVTEKHLEIVDALKRVADELGTTIARAALAWVRARPGVSSTVIGARTLSQLEDNVKSLDVQLTPEQTAKLNELSTPQLPFPIPFLSITPALHAGGTTVNGEPSTPHAFCPTRRGDHY